MRALLALAYYVLVFATMCIMGIPYMWYCGLRGHWEDCTNICRFDFKHFIFKLFRITVSVEGAENIPKERGYVMVLNHQSFLDTNVVWHSIDNAAFMAKASLWKAPVFSWVLTRIGCIPVYSNPRKNAGMGQMVKDRLEKGNNIAVFPEGHRSADGRMFKFQNGIFRMAKEHHFSILPITLVNTGERLPKVKWAIYGGEVKIVVHPLMKYEDYAEMPIAEFRDGMHDLIESALPYKQAEKEVSNAGGAVGEPADKEA
ncbi:MAG: 1-acyl-sn-glycerol-3-phosphate acyltransferase [Fibrobacter sp.]|nr:1-acyl-sn-glycerol-3-phosphate acyltransferase [Fibrobacter sp.]